MVLRDRLIVDTSIPLHKEYPLAGSGSLEDDDSAREKNEKEAYMPPQQEPLDENDHAQESHYPLA
jgi:hypothetical protein